MSMRRIIEITTHQVGKFVQCQGVAVVPVVVVLHNLLDVVVPHEAARLLLLVAVHLAVLGFPRVPLLVQAGGQRRVDKAEENKNSPYHCC